MPIMPLLIRAELHRISGIECRFYKPLIHRLSRPSSGYPGMFQEICVDLRWAEDNSMVGVSQGRTLG
jgi:hypothetical protein